MEKVKICIFSINCQSCTKYHTYGDKTKMSKIKNFKCKDFNLVIMKFYEMNIFKIKLTIVCEECNSVAIKELSLGKTINNNFQDKDDFKYKCCGKVLDISAYFLNEAIIYNEITRFQDEKRDVLGNLPEKKNDIEIINPEDDIINNLVDFSRKDKIINFFDEQNKKNYKILANNSVMLKDLFQDLINQYPEIGSKNIVFFSAGKKISPELKLFDFISGINPIINIKSL